jgi:hypothetical protein
MVQNNYPLEKYLDSDHFLQDPGYCKVYQTLKHFEKKRIIILGANRSAFACANLLLKGFEYHEVREEINIKGSPYYSKRQKAKIRELIEKKKIEE